MIPVLYRVTFFSAFTKPTHYVNLKKKQVETLVQLGKSQQVKVVITDMEDDEPANMNHPSTYVN